MNTLFLIGLVWLAVFALRFAHYVLSGKYEVEKRLDLITLPKNERGQAGLITMLLLGLIVAGMLIVMQGVGFVGAKGNLHKENFVSYTSGCTPYTHGMVLHTYANVLNHSLCNGENDTLTVKHTSKDNASIVTEEIPVTPSPVIEDNTQEDNTSDIVTPPAYVPPTESPIINPPVVTPPTESPSVTPPTDNGNKHPNSGRGNGSEIDPVTGNDIDPGNSGNHNNGGD